MSWKLKNSFGFSLVSVTVGLAIFATTSVMLGVGYQQLIRMRQAAQVKGSLKDIESALLMGIAQRIKAHTISCTPISCSEFVTTFNNNNNLPGIGVFTALSSPIPSVPSNSAGSGLYSFQVSLNSIEGVNRVVSGNSKSSLNFQKATGSNIADQSILEIRARIVEGNTDQNSQLSNATNLANYAANPTQFYFLMSYRWTLSKSGLTTFVQSGSKRVDP